jgi:hypothetical protein
VQELRSTQEAFEDHLRAITPDVVILTGLGVPRGHDGLRRLAKLVRGELPECTYEYRTMLLAGEMAFLEWKAVFTKAALEDGADSYSIRDGRIVAQTIHYTIAPI